MTACMCVVQEGQISAESEAALRGDMTVFANQHFGYPPQFNWVVVAKGNGFTAAKPSNSVIISMRADRSLPLSEREPLLPELGDIWINRTGLTGNEVVTVITDPPA
ncbi:MAG: hypothetical protein AAGL10_09215 [Pseudomonadota bacterium]